MKGLFIKDFKLMMVQKNFFILILAIAMGMMLFSDDIIFPLGFLSFVVSLFTISTISYDDFDNCNAFLFTLPISRKIYVKEKYSLGLILGCSAWVFATILGMAAKCFKPEFPMPLPDLFLLALAILPMVFIILSVMLPFHLKFGSEKGRLALIGAFALLAIIGVGINEGMKLLFNFDISKWLNTLQSMEFGTVVFIEFIISLIILVISLNISQSIMRKKEF